MVSVTDFAAIAALMGDPARAGILEALMDGRSLTASELARSAGVTPQTASGHLAKLHGAGLIAVAQQGRCRYFRIASTAVADVIERLWYLSGELQPTRPGTKQPRIGPRDPALRFARTCYDHLAGALAVRIADSLSERGYLDLSMDGAALSPDGFAYLRHLGACIDPPARATRVFCRPCLDWSERRPHLAGAVGAAICAMCFTRGWIRRSTARRSVTVTPAGQLALTRAFPPPESIRRGAA